MLFMVLNLLCTANRESVSFLGSDGELVPKKSSKYPQNEFKIAPSTLSKEDKRKCTIRCRDHLDASPCTRLGDRALSDVIHASHVNVV